MPLLSVKHVLLSSLYYIVFTSISAQASTAVPPPIGDIDVDIDLDVEIHVDVKVEMDFCLDGDMMVKTFEKGDVKVSSLIVGDRILGVKNQKMDEAWCEVEALYLSNNNGTTFGGFTEGHLLVYSESSSVDATAIVAPAGRSSSKKMGPIYSLLTECDAAFNVQGDLFTPTSRVVCPSMVWSDFLTVLSGFRRIMEKTGTFWFDNTAFYDNHADPLNNGSLVANLPELCIETLKCTKEKNCDKFESLADNFLRFHLRPKELDIVQNVFPNMGHLSSSIDGTLSGTINGVANPRYSFSEVIAFTAVLAIAALALIGYWVWKIKTLPPSKPEDLTCKGVELVASTWKSEDA